MRNNVGKRHMVDNAIKITLLVCGAFDSDFYELECLRFFINIVSNL